MPKLSAITITAEMLAAEDASGGNVTAGGSGTIKVHMQNGLVVARASVGSRTFVCQGPPLEAQLLSEDENGNPPRYIWEPATEVRKAITFASGQTKETTRDDRHEQRRDLAELHEV